MESGGGVVTVRISPVVTVVALMGALGLAVLPWVGVYVAEPGGTRPVAVLWVVVVISVAIPVLVGGRAHRHFPWSLTASLIAYVAVVLTVGVSPMFSPSALVDGYAFALSRLLSSTPPLLTDAGTLVPAITATWAAGATTGELVARTRAVGSLLVAPVVLLVVSLAITARAVFDQPGSAAQVVLGLGVFACLSVTVVYRRIALDAQDRPQISRTERRKLAEAPLFAAAIVVVAALIAVVATDSVPGVVRESPVQAQLETRLDTPLPESPLRTLRNLREDAQEASGDSGGAVLFRVAVDGQTSRYFPVSTFDVYDGSVWRFERRFDPTGFAVDEPGDCVAANASQRYQVEEPIPGAANVMVALGRVVCALPVSIASEAGISEQQVLYDAQSATLWSPEALTQGSTYEVRSKVVAERLEDLDPEEVNLRGVPSAGKLQEALSTSRAEAELAQKVARSWLAEIARSSASSDPEIVDGLQGAAESIEPLVEVLQWLRTNFDLAAPDSSDDGVSVALTVLDQQLRGEGTAGDGSIEQIATLFALVANELVVDARLVTGFRIDEDRLKEAASGELELRAADAWTWAEVFVGDVGWVVADPDPNETTESAEQQQPEEAGGAESTAPSSRVQPLRLGAEPLVEEQPTSSVVIRVVAVVLGIMALGALLGWLAGSRVRRRTRRRKGDPLDASLGAWHETLDTLREARLGDLESLTGPEVAASSTQRFGHEVGGPVTVVATVANPAVFSERPMTPEEAAAAWAATDDVRSVLRDRLTLRQRAGALWRSVFSRRRRQTVQRLPRIR